jgi:hypothetical protein
VIVVTPHGALKFPSVEEAIATKSVVDLVYPIFVRNGPIDRTLIRGPGLGGLDPEDDAWEFLVERSKPYLPAEPIEAKRRKVQVA